MLLITNNFWLLYFLHKRIFVFIYLLNKINTHVCTYYRRAAMAPRLTRTLTLFLPRRRREEQEKKKQKQVCLSKAFEFRILIRNCYDQFFFYITFCCFVFQNCHDCKTFAGGYIIKGVSNGEKNFLHSYFIAFCYFNFCINFIFKIFIVVVFLQSHTSARIEITSSVDVNYSFFI